MFGRENSVTCGPNLEISWQEFAFRWFAVYTRSHCERKLAQELSDKRIENYLPVVPEIHRWKDRKKRRRSGLSRLCVCEDFRQRVQPAGGSPQCGSGANTRPRFFHLKRFPIRKSRLSGSFSKPGRHSLLTRFRAREPGCGLHGDL